ncbi:MAG TPA: YjjG family noncanonical pyrimidine nucleotidase [Vicinamibacteria bacterium]|nr:YjjG family noncanonical pyrimidine nucleotidase [Vicinamibacteria bacterium]
MARLRAVLFDVDNTLLDFDRAQGAALRSALADFGLPCARPTLVAYRQINDALWDLYRRGKIRQPDLARERFRQLLVHLEGDPRRAARLGENFLDHLSARGDRLPGCRTVLSRLAKRFRLGVVTNGIDRVQRARLRASRLGSFFESVVTSEGCGFAKPDPRILHVALDELGVAPRHAVYVGDDAAVDGQAAARAGVAFYWIDRGTAPTRGPRPRRRITHLLELEDSL